MLTGSEKYTPSLALCLLRGLTQWQRNRINHNFGDFMVKDMVLQPASLRILEDRKKSSREKN